MSSSIPSLELEMECNVLLYTILTCLCFSQILDGCGYDLQKIQCQGFTDSESFDL
jgi:hypothetical protein